MSRFKWRDLLQLDNRNDSFKSPLSVLCHIDVNSFYAQVEQVRCGYSKEDPVVCVQWQSLIAVSYAAKRYGITRMDTIQNAFRKCDKLIPIHTAVFKKGEDFWQYHDGCGSWNPDPNKKLPVEQYKVSLDPYRRESRKIFKIFTEYFDLTEKASIDEVFLDLGRLCLNRLIFDESLQCDGMNALLDKMKGGQYELDDNLPPLPLELRHIKFVGDVFNPLNRPISDWDDVIFALGSQITQLVRDEIENTLGYTTSCGIARTKNICKLASGFKKPNAQTIIRNQCLEDFLDCGSFEITSFWTLGGNLGRELISALNLPSNGTIKYVRDNWPDLESLKDFLDSQALTDEISKKKEQLTGKLYGFVRGSYLSPLTSQTMVKSMSSNKNMRSDACSDFGDCISWLQVFSGELSSRLIELAQEYNKKIIPKTISVTAKDCQKNIHSKSSTFMLKNGKIHGDEIHRQCVKLMAELDAKYATANKGYYPLQNINMTLSNLEIVDEGKTVLDMMYHDIRDPARPSTKLDLVAKTLKCSICRQIFENEKLYQEHLDFEFAVKLSKKLNHDSRSNGSIAEKRLMEKHSRSTSVRQKKTKSSGSYDILTYFKK